VKKAHWLYRISALVGTILLPIAAVLAAGTSEASAATPAASAAPGGICAGVSCLNAWNGGPYVNAYTGGTSNANDDFDVFQEPDGNVYIAFLPGSGIPWNGDCVGDAGNVSGNARVSLDPCGTNGQGAGWGTQFEWIQGNGSNGCPSGSSAFYNIHWGGYLGPQQSGVNGSPFYLNKPGKVCFNV
jgi:hypothetical protein